MGQLDGGIVGQSAGNSGGTVICEQCFSTGVIGNFAGGIFGDYAGNGGTAQAIKCYTTGSIGGNGGGIFGRYAGNNGLATAEKCYSRGNIGADGGGIFGIGAGSSGGTTTATNCYSNGIVTTVGKGIYGTGKVNGTETNCYSANGSWSTATANSNLTGVPSGVIVGATWVGRGVDQPYELSEFGYTPYSIININSSTKTLIETYSASIKQGETTISAIVSGKSYEILEISDGDPSSYNTITINSTTGVISTTSSTVAGLYTIYVRNTGSYNITTFELTITNAQNYTVLNGLIFSNIKNKKLLKTIIRQLINTDVTDKTEEVIYDLV